MTVLADHIRVAGRFARSANVERDIAATEPLDGYVVTARALDVVERVASAAASGPAGGAWSLTGPYGSGKSSLALLLDAAWGNDSAPRRAALKLIAEASPAAAELIASGHKRHGTHESGFHRGLVTAGREPLSRTVLRALQGAVVRSFGRVPPTREFKAADALRGAMEDAAAADPRRTGPSPAALVEVARTLAADRPLLVVIDEFGKNLEAIGDGGDTDPYLLQQLAEAGQGAGLPIFLLTLQHLSFEDYLAGVDGPQRREWAKVQGRFEDVAFVESPAQTRALIATVFDNHRFDIGGVDSGATEREREREREIISGPDRSLGGQTGRGHAPPRDFRPGRPGRGRVLLSPSSARLAGPPGAVQPLRPARADALLVPNRPGPSQRRILPRPN